jgi:Domain of unknown function (DUF6531)/RHS Repeat
MMRFVRTVLPVHPRTLVVSLVALAVLVALFPGAPPLARADASPKPPTAPPGAAPARHPLPLSSLPNHGYPAGQRPPVVPPGTPAANTMQRLPASRWSAVPKPGTRGPDGGPPPPSGGARNVLARPGFALDDTSLVVYFDAADPGVSDWTSWIVTVYDPDTQAAQDSVPQSPDKAEPCQVPRQFCGTFGAAQGWSLTDGHAYFVTVTVTLKDGSRVVSEPSATAAARATASPPPLSPAQSAGCACGDILAPTTVAQAVRGSGVQTGTGGFTTVAHDLQMAGFGVPFEAVRRYSSTNTSAGSLGLGWSWTYDVRVIPPATETGAITVRAEDGAQAVYSRAADGSYVRPPGVRSNVRATATGWRLTTPDQISYDFDRAGRLTSIRDPRGLGTTVAYAPTKWTITDAAGRLVTIDLRADGLVTAVTLPDKRMVRFSYSGGQLSAATDVSGATWRYGYTAGLLTTLTDPHKRVQVTNVYVGDRVAQQTDAQPPSRRRGERTVRRWGTRSTRRTG